MLVYVALFIAAIVLRYKKPHVERSYQVPGGKAGMWLWAVLGILSSVAVIGLGFIPPSQLDTGGLLKYETILVVGMIVLCLPPVIIYRLQKKHV
jgi:amino acid transporter